MAAKKSNTPVLIGLAAAGGVGYYLYKAGGDPKAAEKKFESRSTTALPLLLELPYEELLC